MPLALMRAVTHFNRHGDVRLQILSFNIYMGLVHGSCKMIGPYDFDRAIKVKALAFRVIEAGIGQELIRSRR